MKTSLHLKTNFVITGNVKTKKLLITTIKAWRQKLSFIIRIIIINNWPNDS